MLGPIDLRDWADDGYHLRAAIRLLPLMERYRADPQAVRVTIGDDLARRIEGFIKCSALTSQDLNRLLADLTAVDSTRIILAI